MEWISMECEKTVSWNEISNSVEDMLWGIGWSDNIKMLWAEKAWRGIVKSGLADYHNELERSKVFIRLFASIILYKEFCSITMEETFSIEIYDWLDQVEISHIRIGQLLGASFELEEPDNFTLVESGLMALIEQTKKEVWLSLCKEFGGINLLFVGLWLTYEYPEESLEEENEEEVDERGNNDAHHLDLFGYEELIKNTGDLDLNFDLTFIKAEAYSWLMSV
jgi:hypothetical protein